MTALSPAARRVLLFGALAALPPLLFGLWPGDEPTRLSHLIVGYGLAGLPYLYVWRNWSDLGSQRSAFVWLMVVAASTRLALLVLPPLLSEDLWRYLWDGAVQWAGIDPYRFAPDASALDALATDPELAAIRGRIGHAHIPTIYPPAAQITFFVATIAGPYALVLRAVLVVADLTVIGALWRWAGRLGRRPQLAALYALAPLPMLESAVGGHVDAVGVAGLAVAGLALSSNRVWTAGLGLAVGIWTKLLPLLALPVLLRTRPKAVVATAIAAVALLAPYLAAGGHLLTGLTTYGQRWRANDGLFRAVLWLFEQVVPPGDQPVDLPAPIVEIVRSLVGPNAQPGQVWPDEVAFAGAKLVAGGLFGLVCLWCWWKARGLEDALGPMLATLFLVSPVIHPWYLMWILPLAALAWDRPEGAPPWSAAMLVWGLTAWLAYVPRPEYLRSGQWLDGSGRVLIEYAPVWALLIWRVWAQKMKPMPNRSS